MVSKYFHLELSHISDNNKNIFFLGDSFTWGQGLYLYNWLETSPDIFYNIIKKSNEKEIILQYAHQHPYITKNDLEYKNKFSFTNLVAERIKYNCYKKIDNGGNNFINFKTLNSIEKNENTIIVFQFTNPGRDEFDSLSDSEFIEFYGSPLDSAIREIYHHRLLNLFKQIDDTLIEFEKKFGCKYLYLDWLGDFWKFKPEKFVKFENQYFFNNLVNNQNIIIDYKDRKIIDNHINKQGNIMIGDAILNYMINNLEIS